MTTIPIIKFQEAALATGVQIRYADIGPASGNPVLFLHGYSDSWFSFSPVLEHMPATMRMVIPDQRGHGDSSRPKGSYSPEQLARDAAALLEVLRVPAAVVVGHSMGSFVAQSLASIAPKRVARLILVGSAPTADNAVVRSLRPVVEALTDPVDAAFVREFQLSTIHRAVPEEFLERVILESLKLPAFVWKAALAGMLDLPTLDRLSTVRCPTSIFWGDRDSIFGRAEQDTLLRLLPGSRLEVFEDVGHALHWEAPEDFARRLNAVIGA